MKQIPTNRPTNHPTKPTNQADRVLRRLRKRGSASSPRLPLRGRAAVPGKNAPRAQGAERGVRQVQRAKPRGAAKQAGEAQDAPAGEAYSSDEREIDMVDGEKMELSSRARAALGLGPHAAEGAPLPEGMVDRAGGQAEPPATMTAQRQLFPQQAGVVYPL